VAVLNINETENLHIVQNITPASETINVLSTISLSALQAQATHIIIHLNEIVDVTQTIVNTLEYHGKSYSSYDNINLSIHIKETINIFQNPAPSAENIVISDPITIFDHNIAPAFTDQFVGMLGSVQNGALTLPSQFLLQNSGQLHVTGVFNPPSGEEVDLQGTINIGPNSPPSNGTYEIDNPITLIGSSFAPGGATGPFFG
jgi:hypothetical protein